jgi:16S rRNA (cytosine967-C5)-methyltransferase
MLTTDAPRLQPLLVRAVVEALFSIFCENRHADKVIEFVLRNNRKAGSRDRAFGQYGKVFLIGWMHWVNKNFQPFGMTPSPN